MNKLTFFICIVAVALLLAVAPAQASEPLHSVNMDAVALAYQGQYTMTLPSGQTGMVTLQVTAGEAINAGLLLVMLMLLMFTMVYQLVQSSRARN